MRWTIVARLVVALALLGGASMWSACNRDQATASAEKKASPDDIIGVLTTAGMKVEKKGSVGGPKVEIGMELAVDGTVVIAKRYPEVALARDTAQTWSHGVSSDFWAFDCADELTAQKVQRVLKK